MSEASETNVVQKAQEYYNSTDADNFYFSIWGGEDIHIGLYQSEDEPILDASARTVATMASKIPAGFGPEHAVLDLGAGYGGSVRHLVKHYGCRATALNLSEVQNERDREKNREQGLDDKIEVIDGNFESLPMEDNSFDGIWSQDSFLHSGNRFQVFEEADRVLKPGGWVIFTDILQKEPADREKLQPVYDRIHLDSLGSLDAYREYASRLNWDWVEFEDHSHQLPNHYDAVRRSLMSRREDLENRQISAAYIDRMLAGLEKWVEAGRAGLLQWGIVVCRKPR